jgi:hypothetical protein
METPELLYSINIDLWKSLPLTPVCGIRGRITEGQCGRFQNLRAMSMTVNETTREAIPHQGTRILSCLATFSLPHESATNKRIRWEIKPRGTKGHGIARALENLRGVRLSLVPRPNRGECLLRAMSDQTQGISFAREPETSRASASETFGQGLGRS